MDEVMEAHGSESFNSVRVNGSCKHIHQQAEMFKWGDLLSRDSGTVNTQ